MMDVFGKAIYDYWKGDKKTPLYWYNSWSKDWDVRPVKRYLRSPSSLTKLEKELISLARGTILDVGCATGYYVPLLSQKGETIGIDLSKNLIEIAHKRGVNNCYVGDIYTISKAKQYDTITLLENNLGLGGSIKRIKQLLALLKTILKSNGQILAIQRNINTDYKVVEITAKYKGKQETWNWVQLGLEYTKKLCVESGLHLQVLDTSYKSMYLARITKNRT